jgi:hypothetical protein
VPMPSLPRLARPFTMTPCASASLSATRPPEQTAGPSVFG